MTGMKKHFSTIKTTICFPTRFLPTTVIETDSSFLSMQMLQLKQHLESYKVSIWLHSVTVLQISMQYEVHL